MDGGPTNARMSVRTARVRRALVWALALAFAAFLVVSVALPGVAQAFSTYTAPEQEFLGLINQYRQANGLGTLLISDVVSDAAEKHDKDMGTYAFFDHTTKNSDYFPVGSLPWDRMAICGYGYNTSKGENIAAGYATAAAVFAAWKSSSGHNANMLNDSFKVIGISMDTVSGSPYGTYWTTDFGGFVDSSAHDLGGGTTTTTSAPATTTTTTVRQTTTTVRQTTTTVRQTTTTTPATTTTTTAAPTTTTTAPRPTTTTTTTARTTTTTTPPRTTTTTLPPGFIDVPADYRFYNEVMSLAGAEIIGGFSDGFFRPDDPVKRAQFAKIIMLAVGAHTDPIEAAGEATFPDVPWTGLCYPFDYVEEAADLGIIKGLNGGLFGPYDNITRAQLALMLVRAGGAALTAPPPGYTHGFRDVPSFADEAVAVARYNGLLTGKTDELFDPYGVATRGQVAKMTSNLVGRLSK